MRPSSFPPKLQKFVKSVEKRAKTAGVAESLARIYGAWSACFVRYCTVNDRSWRDPDNVPVFIDYLATQKDVGESSRERVAESLVFLFEELLEADVSGASWHPDRQDGADASAEEDEEETLEAEEGEQSNLLTRLLFHTSLPISEAMELCAGDVDLESELIYVSDAMGTPKQIVELPDELYDPLRKHLQKIREKHGPRYYDAPLFQARALKGRVDEPTDQDDEEDDADSMPSEASTERPATLWG